MNKTPDEIKKGLRGPIPAHSHGVSPEKHLTPLAYLEVEALFANALAYIQQLETANAEQSENIKWMEAERDDFKRTIRRLQAERDAALVDLRETALIAQTIFTSGAV